MTRRGFLSQILKAGVAAAVLPAATTYARSKWIKPSVTSNLWIPNPAYETAEYEVFLTHRYLYAESWEYTKLLGVVKWEPNMGSTMRGI